MEKFFEILLRTPQIALPLCISMLSEEQQRTLLVVAIVWLREQPDNLLYNVQRRLILFPAYNAGLSSSLGRALLTIERVTEDRILDIIGQDNCSEKIKALISAIQIEKNN